ncbi:cell wall integrity and stress response component 1-like [Teratosphaeria destructans]|uniref:Cell wall integrity and stress response component 1-like n=1 Tax=Teratosphaeria destructans TaxID=418781 RepID=A0A9W7W7A8_9PEZI|nr:cell wall integrity and stress response component 1-like [Teratosphaeria destructans]
MRVHLAPRPLLPLITAILLAPSAHANPAPTPAVLAGFTFNELFARYECSGTYCGYSSQLCCTGGSACYTDASDQAQCGPATATAAAAAGSWQYFTTTYVETDLRTITSTYSSQIYTATAVATASCNYALNESPCGSICCASGQYCYVAGQCLAAGGGSSGYYSTYYSTMTSTMANGGTTTIVVGATATAPLRATSSGVMTVTSTRSATTTIPFETPVATGANITLTSTKADHSGLSGGEIAGIVIGVLVGLALIALICFYCCLKGLLDGCLAVFGLGGRKKRRVTEVEEYERRRHHSSGGGSRTWYGAAKRPPTRVSRYDERDRRNDGSGKGLLAVGGGLAALWALLGLKRRRNENNRRRNEEKYSEYSYDSEYYSYTSPTRAQTTEERETRAARGRGDDEDEWQ